MTAHVDVAARAATQELSSERLAQIIGGTKLPLQKAVFEDFTKVWVAYQLLGHAAAHNDSLTDRKAIDDAMWPAVTQQKLQKFYEQVSASLPHDTASEANYATGNILIARHILLLTKPTAQGAPPLAPAQVDSVRRAAEALRAQVTSANFETLAKSRSQDPGSARQGGLLPPFHGGEMVPAFEQAVRELKPGEISPLVQTEYGFHIIQRLPYSQAKAAYSAEFAKNSTRGAESTYVARLEQSGKIQVKKDAPAKVKAIMRDPDSYRNDKSVLATSSNGDFTGAQFVRWSATLPPQLVLQIQNAPDSLLPDLVKAMVRNDLMLHRADSMKIGIDSAQLTAMYGQVKNVVVQLWQELGVDPSALAQAGKTVTEREKIAGERVNQFLDDLVAGRKQYAPVPNELSQILRSKYESKIIPQGIDRAFERAQKTRASSDSTGRAAQPPSNVPLPQQAPAGAGTRAP
ncbi:MAG TPA: peptidylprolyl isomerase [Gemmatimonadaceae bacterium]|nr:peptidylprolyl isomerase [Gemmatimonadaceae bacterium]